MANKIKLTNQSGGPLEVKEGTGTTWRNLTTLQNNGVYSISVDPDATRREYWCVTKDSGPNKLIISSDDCQECKSVTVKVGADGTYHLDKESRNGTGTGGSAGEVKPQDHGVFSKVKDFVGRKLQKGSTSTITSEKEEPDYLDDLN